jgi:hypothetical protein
MLPYAIQTTIFISMGKPRVKHMTIFESIVMMYEQLPLPLYV